MAQLNLSRQLQLDDQWDVIVAGGGPAGCTAAIAAARLGARTLLIEATGCLGGMGTSGLIPAWCPFSDQEKIIYRGLAEKILQASKQGVAHIAPEAVNWVHIDPERLKRVYDDAVTEAGVTVRFFTTLAAVETNEPGRVSAIVTTDKQGLKALRAKVYVDGTGDGDLAAWAGAEFEKGDADGTLQPATHCFSLGNVDEYHYRHGPLLHPFNRSSPIFDIVKSGRFDLILDTHMCNNLVGPRTVGFNAGHLWDVDNTEPDTVTRAMMLGRRQVEQFRQALAEYHPKAFASAFVNATAPLMGIRETRRIVGLYSMTLDDYMQRRSFDDEIARNNYFIDVHYTPEDAAKRTRGELDEEKRALRYGRGESHGIPYRCLVPRDLHNVLVSGRSISCDRSVHGSVRVMPVCLVTGEAAGAAAAMAATVAQPDTHAVDVAALREHLRQNGAYLP
jgi:glycine/D-amino acid oxidase-like deaminating enzyme